MGNPLHYTDPSGHDPIDALAFLAGILYGWGHANLVALGPIVPQPAMAQYDALAVDSDAFTEGRIIGGLATIAQGTGEGGAGITAVTGGGLVCGTGVGCLLGGGEAVAAGAGLVVHGTSAGIAGAVEAGQQSNILFSAKTPGQIQKSIRSIERNIAQHEEKLAQYRNDPEAYDNLGLLNGLPEALRRKIIEGRIAKLQNEISGFQSEIAKLQKLLEKDSGE